MNLTTVHKQESEITETQPPRPILDDATANQCLHVLHVAILIFSVLGIVNNVINICVFVRQGVTSDSTTVSLFALAISDLLGCFFQAPLSIFFYVEKYTTMENIVLKNLYTLAFVPAGYPHLVFARVTCWITVYMSVERALCVLIPFKIKTVFSPTTSVIAMSVIFGFIVSLHIPYPANTTFMWIYDPATNKSTKAAIYETPLGKLFVKFNNIFWSTALTTVAMVIVVITTAIMLVRLKSSTKWRASLTSSKIASEASMKLAASPEPSSLFLSSSKKSSSKEIETIKTVSAVTCVFLACLAVSHIPALGVIFVPGMSLSGYNGDLFHIVITFRHLFNILNSSVNLFFYVKMSSRYRKVFFDMFCETTARVENILRAGRPGTVY